MTNCRSGEMSAPQPPPAGIREDAQYKNRLQEYTQKASMALPVYKTTSEGQAHAPKFRSSVCVDGTWFTTHETFPNRKTAEQEAAKYALIGIQLQIKQEGSSRVLADTLFCKSIINEYVVKMNLGMPSYTTTESKAFLPLFVSTLVLNGVTYVGEVGKNKKEAEQFAARAAILSIIDDSESNTTISEIVRSKYKFYDALKSKGSYPIQCGDMQVGANVLEDGATCLLVNERKEVSISEDAGASCSAAITKPNPLALLPEIQPPPLTTLKQNTSAQATHQLLDELKRLKSHNWLAASTDENPDVNPMVFYPQIQQLLLEKLEKHSSAVVTHKPLHEYNKPKQLATSTAADATGEPPIVSVPPLSVEAPVVTTSAKKRKRKKAKKKNQHQSMLPAITIEQTSAPHYSVAQQAAALQLGTFIAQWWTKLHS